MANTVGEDFVLFVECVFSMHSLGFYQYDVGRLLLLLRKTHDEAGNDPWYVQRNHPLTTHCEYMIIKMREDIRGRIQEVPFWLRALAGKKDKFGTGHLNQKEAYSSLCEVLPPLLKKYGPDARVTIPPPDDI
ncbi:MAG: hypothetical protein ACYC44_02760 [Patescibacteria group bacterium]